MMKTITFTLLIILFAGCMSQQTRSRLAEFRDNRVWETTYWKASFPIKEVVLTEDHFFEADTSVFDKNIKFTLKKSKYLLKYENSEGIFFEGDDRCVMHTTLTGINKLNGGFFVPHDTKRKIMLWAKDEDGSATMSFGGAPIVVSHKAKPNRAYFIIAMPPEQSMLIRKQTKAEANQELEPTTTAVTDSATQTPRQP